MFLPVVSRQDKFLIKTFNYVCYYYYNVNKISILDVYTELNLRLILNID